jgi:histidinol-phosphatase (PHP family)
MNTNILTDLHMHSTFSPDGDDTPDTMCRQAIQSGMSAIAITEHAEWQPPRQAHGFARVDEYFKAIETCQETYKAQGLTVYAGVELGNPHQYEKKARQLLENHPFDVVIASLHWLDGKNIHLEACFAGRDIYDVYRQYFRELGYLAANFEFDILAHWDRIVWRGTLLGDKFDPWRIENEIKDSLVSVAAHNRVLELNTRFIGEPINWNEAVITVLNWFAEVGGRRVVVNSDAHRRDEIGRDFEIAAQLLTHIAPSVPLTLYTLTPAAV